MERTGMWAIVNGVKYPVGQVMEKLAQEPSKEALADLDEMTGAGILVEMGFEVGPIGLQARGDN